MKRHSILGQPGQCLNLVCRGVFGAAAGLTIFYAFRLLPLGDAATLQYTSPIFVVIVARIMIKEPIKLIQVLTGVMSVVGALIISKPETVFGQSHKHQWVSSTDRLVGTILGISSAISMAFATIFIRKLKNVALPVVIIWFSIIAMPMGLTVLVILKALTLPKLWPHGALILAMGGCGILGQLFLTSALRYEKAGPVSVVRTFSIFLAFVWDITIFSHALEWTSLIGALLVLTSVIILAIAKMNEENPHLFDCVKFWRSKRAEISGDISHTSTQQENSIETSATSVSNLK